MVVINEMMTAIDDDILQKKDRWNRGYRLPGRWKRGQASSSCNGIVMREEEDDGDNMGGASMKAGGGEGASSSSRLDDNTKYTYKPYPHCLNNNEVFDDADTYEVHTPEEWLRLITRKDNDEDYHDMVHNGGGGGVREVNRLSIRFLKEDAHSWARRQEVYRRNKEEYYKRIRFINVINNTTSLSSSLPSDNGHITSLMMIPNDEWYDDIMNKIAHAIRHPSCSRYYGYAIPWPYGDSSDGGGRRRLQVVRGVGRMLLLLLLLTMMIHKDRYILREERSKQQGVQEEEEAEDTTTAAPGDGVGDDDFTRRLDPHYIDEPANFDEYISSMRVHTTLLIDVLIKEWRGRILSDTLDVVNDDIYHLVEGNDDDENKSNSSRIVMDPTPQQLKDGILHMVEYALNDSLSLLKPVGQDMMNNNNEVLHSNSGDGHDNILHNNNTDDDDDIVMGIRRRTKEITMEALDSSLKMPLQVLTWYNVYLPLLGIDDDYDGITLTSTDKDDEHIINTINTAKQHQHQLEDDDMLILYKLRKCREDIINICPEGIIQYKMFEIHTKGVTDTFIKVIDDAMRSILDYMYDDLCTRLDSMERRWEECLHIVTSVAQSEEDLSKLKSYMSSIGEDIKKPNMEELNDLKEIYNSVLSEYYYHRIDDNTIIERIITMSHWPLTIAVECIERGKRIEVEKRDFINKLANDKEEFTRDIIQWNVDMKHIKDDLDDITKANEYAVKVSGLHDRLMNGQKRVDNFHKREALFGIEPTDTEALDTITSIYNDYYSLWSIAIDYKCGEDEWMKGSPLMKLRAVDIHNSINKWKTEINKLEKDVFNDNINNPVQVKVIDDLKNRMQYFVSEYMWIIESIGIDGCEHFMLPRYWYQILHTIKTPTTTTAAAVGKRGGGVGAEPELPPLITDLTLNHLDGINNNRDKVKAVIKEAKQQYSNRITLSDIKKEWLVSSSSENAAGVGGAGSVVVGSNIIPKIEQHADTLVHIKQSLPPPLSTIVGHAYLDDDEDEEGVLLAFIKDLDGFCKTMRAIGEVFELISQIRGLYRLIRLYNNNNHGNRDHAHQQQRQQSGDEDGDDDGDVIGYVDEIWNEVFIPSLVRGCIKGEDKDGGEARNEREKKDENEMAAESSNNDGLLSVSLVVVMILE
ncbi:hypothetical protein FOZ60_004968 [Perkinsus olseni]|uniref:Dynein heavy chain linker domain-containing protein n=1 Tax=Perkinsus olseni TaxID=32597 RepID=A0A7J6NS17_PEROL|nr:hypothetical protein FOZ60_004968 [Perkinsus olseni]